MKAFDNVFGWPARVWAAFAPPELSGIIYDVMHDAWRLSADTDVNYIAATRRVR